MWLLTVLHGNQFTQIFFSAPEFTKYNVEKWVEADRTSLPVFTLPAPPLVQSLVSLAHSQCLSYAIWSKSGLWNQGFGLWFIGEWWTGGGKGKSRFHRRCWGGGESWRGAAQGGEERSYTPGPLLVSTRPSGKYVQIGIYFAHWLPSRKGWCPLLILLGQARVQWQPESTTKPPDTHLPNWLVYSKLLSHPITKSTIEHLR